MATPPPNSDSTAPLPATEPPRLLVIDDASAIHEDFRKILTEGDWPGMEEAEAALFGPAPAAPGPVRFQLDSAHQGQEGLALVQRARAEGRPYALAFVDVRMPPGWDGIETTARLWEADPDLQVVICTAFTDYSWEEIARRLGNTDSLLILKKPFETTEVLQLAHALSKKWLLARQAKGQLHDLDQLVHERTRELRAANEQLRNEIAERECAELRSHRLTRLYSVLSKVNELIVRARAATTLYQEACRIAVEDGLFRLAWVGLLEPATQVIAPVAHWGFDEGYLPCTCSASAAVPEGLGPVGTAVRDRRYDVCNDVEAEPRMAPWRASALQRGYHSLAAFPLNVKGQTVGAIAFYNVEPNYFTEEEIRLLDQMAADLSFAVECIEQEQQRQAAELRLRAFSSLAHRLSSARSVKAAAQVIVEIADQLIGWDACFCSLYSAEENTVQHVLNIDVLNGQRAEGPPVYDKAPPSVWARRAIQEGGHLILHEPAKQKDSEGQPFGDTARRSASILYVPIRNDSRVIGVLSIQSYTPKAYTQHSLETLQTLADHCGAALDRIRTEEALRATQEHLHHLVHHNPAIIYSLKTDGQTVTPAWISDNILQMTGYTSAEVCHPDWWSTHVHPGDWEQAAAPAFRVPAQDRPAAEYRIRHKQGHYRWIRDERCLVRSAQGQPAEILGSWMDITQRKELEDRYRQAQKMEAIGQLAGGVAHDFNNLLLVIHGNAELLLMDAAQHSGHTVDCLNQITAAAERAAKLTRQLLAFSRKQVMQSQPLSLNEVVANLTKMLQRIIGEHIQLQCQYAPQLPLVQADTGMLEQVLVNLVVNARDAMPQGGQLRIVTHERQLSPEAAQASHEARPGAFVCLSVTDTGVGIAPEHLPHIFEPFFTTKEVGKGTGLGLATAYGIAKQHQGWMDVTSAPGAGTTFNVYLPALTGPTGLLAETAAEAPLHGGTETILLVEDDPAVRSLTRRLLENFGYRVQESACGRDALDQWRDRLGALDLVLTDVLMPQGISGRDLAEQLRTQRPDLRVIFLSGYTADIAGKDSALFQQARTRFLQKPCSWKDLLLTVRQCLDEA